MEEIETLADFIESKIDLLMKFGYTKHKPNRYAKAVYHKLEDIEKCLDAKMLKLTYDAAIEFEEE